MKSKPMRVACVGEVMIELRPTDIPGSMPVGVAGDTLNTAIYLRRNLSDAHDVSYVTMLGQDQMSDSIINYIRQENLETDGILRHASRHPGLYSIATTADGERSFTYWRGQSAARCLFQQDNEITFAVLENFEVIYLSGITLAILPQNVRIALLDWLRDFRQRGGLFAFDSNFRPTLWESPAQAREIVSAAWKLCDIALPSVDDEQELFGEATDEQVLQRFSTYTQCKGALKRSSSGPLPINEQIGNVDNRFPRAADVVDTTAAGDSFSGAFIASYIDDKNLLKAMVSAHEQAVRVVGHAGAIIPA